MDRRNPTISVRVPPAIIAKMDAAIATGMYRNRADYILCALRMYQSEEVANGGGGCPVQTDRKVPDDP